jgi:hypothetical protein
MSNGSNKSEEPAKDGGQVNPETQDEVTPDIREEQIRLAAYFRWEAKGKQHGYHDEDWAEAEDSLTDSNEE